MYHSFLIVLADAAAATPAPATGSHPFDPTPIVTMVCIFAIIYFAMIRPQSQRAKHQDELIKGIKTGDKVITASGIHGLISNVKETTVIVKIADNVKIEMEKSSIGTVKRAEAETASAS